MDSLIIALDETLFTILLVINSSQVFAAGSGSVCVAPMPGRHAYNGPAMTQVPSYIGPGDTLVIHIGEKEMIISPASGGKIDGLSLESKHLVRIRRANITTVSFWFDFKKENSSNLCLWYYLGYGTFSMLNASDDRCKWF